MHFTANMNMDKKANILVVDDERAINYLLYYNLRKEGFLVKQAFDGIEASKILAEEKFDIVILDLMLPGVDGFQLCRQIRQDARFDKSFVIVISAKSDNEDKLYAHLLGAHAYLAKPFFIKDLINIVNEFDECLERRFAFSA